MDDNRGSEFAGWTTSPRAVEGVKTICQEPFNPVPTTARGHAKMLGNGRNAPACVTKAQHLQAVSCARLGSFVVTAMSQFRKLISRQMDAVHDAVYQKQSKHNRYRLGETRSHNYRRLIDFGLPCQRKWKPGSYY